MAKRKINKNSEIEKSVEKNNIENESEIIDKESIDKNRENLEENNSQAVSKLPQINISKPIN